MEKPFMTQREAALRLGISYTTFREAVEDGKVPTVQIGRRRRIPARWVQDLVGGLPWQANAAHAPR